MLARYVNDNVSIPGHQRCCWSDNIIVVAPPFKDEAEGRRSKEQKDERSRHSTKRAESGLRMCEKSEKKNSE